MSSTAHTPAVTIVGAGFGGIGMAIRLAPGRHRRRHDPGDGPTASAACGRPTPIRARPATSRRPCTPSPSRPRPTGPAATRRSRRSRPTCTRPPSASACCRGSGSASRSPTPASTRTARGGVLDLADGGTVECDVLVTACGQLSRPALPPIAGRTEFAGTAFHSATWRARPRPDRPARRRRRDRGERHPVPPARRRAGRRARRCSRSTPRT